jgi:F-type H+-transporting ATPase subunit epsilon
MNKSRLKVEVITQEAQMFAGEVDKITLPGSLGEMTILPQHESLMSALQAGEVTLYDGLTTKHMIISPGFVQVADDTVLVLADSAVREEALNEQQAAKARAAAEAAMDDSYSDTQIAMTLGTIDRTFVELKAIRKGRGGAHRSHASHTPTTD